VSRYKKGWKTLVYMNWIDSRSQSRRVSLLEDAELIVCFLHTIWYCLHRLNKVFNMHLISFLLCVTKRKWKLAPKDRGIMSVQKYAASERQYTAAGGESHVPLGGIHEWRKVEQGDWYTDRQTQFCLSFIALWWQNGRFQIPQSCQFINRSSFRSSPLSVNCR